MRLLHMPRQMAVKSKRKPKLTLWNRIAAFAGPVFIAANAFAIGFVLAVAWCRP